MVVFGLRKGMDSWTWRYPGSTTNTASTKGCSVKIGKRSLYEVSAKFSRQQHSKKRARRR